MAIDRGYKALAEKNESYEICFIPDNDYRGFLKRRVSGLEEKVKGGNFISVDGDNIIDLGELTDYIYKSIPENLRKQPGSLRQNPKFNGTDLKRIILDMR